MKLLESFAVFLGSKGYISTTHNEQVVTIDSRAYLGTVWTVSRKMESITYHKTLLTPEVVIKSPTLYSVVPDDGRQCNRGWFEGDPHVFSIRLLIDIACGVDHYRYN